MLDLSDSTVVAVAAAALLFGPALTGCLDLGDDGDPALALEPAADSRTTTPGGSVAFPVAVGPNATNATDGNLSISVVESGSLEVDPLDLPPLGENGTGTFVEVQVPDDAETTDHEIKLRAEAGDVVGPTLTLTVTVEETDATVEPGDKVEVHYVGRFPNGSVFATSLEAIHSGPYQKADVYRSTGPSEPLNVTVGPQARFIQGFNDGVIGLGVGHDATFSVPPEDAYGNETREDTRPRTEELDRNITTERETPTVSRDDLEQEGIVNESSEEGDHVDYNGDTYNISFLNSTHGRLYLLVEEGDTTTHYEQWPNSSEAVHVNDTHVSYRVTPTTEVGENFTYYDYWPNRTAVAEVTNDTIVVEHTPEVGTTYTPPGFRSTQQTVVEVREDEIVYEAKNRHPLAGQTLVFDVSVLGTS